MQIAKGAIQVLPISRKFRFDFRVAETHADEDGVISFLLVPNEDRYERRIIKGEAFWYDKYDNLLVPESEVKKMADQLVDLPLFYTPPEITKENLDAYLRDSKTRIESRIREGSSFAVREDESDAFLKRHEDESLEFVVLIMDLVGSTKMSQRLDEASYKLTISVLAEEMTRLVAAHNGYVLKFTGDGLIAYFPARENFVGMNDNAVDCSQIMRILMLTVINKVFVENDLPELQFRIGIDCGKARILVLGAAKIRTVRDLLGYTVNIAAKICQKAEQNTILIGESVYRNIHVTRKKFFKALDPLPSDWSYTDDSARQIYKLFAS